jgi:ribonuclease VapC
VFFAEARAPWVIEQLAASAGSLRMSTVNLAETLLRVRDRQPAGFPAVERRLLAGPIAFVPRSTEHARLAAEARLRFPLNLGDCFAYALAMTEDEPLLTLDTDFAKTDVKLVER